MRTVRISEAAEITGLSEYKLREMADKGEIPSTLTKGNHRRFKMSDLANLNKPVEIDRLLHKLNHKQMRELDKFVAEVFGDKAHPSHIDILRKEIHIVRKSDWAFGNEERAVVKMRLGEPAVWGYADAANELAHPEDLKTYDTIYKGHRGDKPSFPFFLFSDKKVISFFLCSYGMGLEFLKDEAAFCPNPNFVYMVVDDDFSEETATEGIQQRQFISYADGRGKE